MDGTTAGALGPVPPLPQIPVQPAVYVPLAAAPIAGVVPLGTPVPVAQQFSQLTPVYAPSPTNTLADIPQPAVKGIEFVQTPGIVQPQPITSVLPPPPMAAPIPVAVPVLIAPPSAPSAQLIQPVLPSSAPVVQLQPPIQPLATQTVQPLTIAEMSGPANYAKIENQIEDVDLDQMVNAIPASMPQSLAVQNPVPVTPVQPVLPIPPAPATTYFQNARSIVSDVPIDDQRSRLSAMDPRTIRRIVIIAAVVIVVGIGGYFIVSGIIGSQQTATTPATETSESSETDKIVEPTPTDTPAVTEENTPTTTTPAGTETPAATTTPPADTTEVPATTIVEQPVFESSDRVPGVANSGIR